MRSFVDVESVESRQECRHTNNRKGIGPIRSQLAFENRTRDSMSQDESSVMESK